MFEEKNGIDKENAWRLLVEDNASEFTVCARVAARRTAWSARHLRHCCGVRYVLD
jgi:hypothetical protein